MRNEIELDSTMICLFMCTRIVWVTELTQTSSLLLFTVVGEVLLFCVIILVIITFRKCVLSWKHYHEIYDDRQRYTHRFYACEWETHTHTHLRLIQWETAIGWFVLEIKMHMQFLILSTHSMSKFFEMCATSWNKKPIWINTASQTKK